LPGLVYKPGLVKSPLNNYHKPSFKLLLPYGP
jgi:hypothetical protein